MLEFESLRDARLIWARLAKCCNRRLSVAPRSSQGGTGGYSGRVMATTSPSVSDAATSVRAAAAKSLTRSPPGAASLPGLPRSGGDVSRQTTAISMAGGSNREDGNTGGSGPSVLVYKQIQKVKHADGTKSINGFRIIRELGEGAFAKVKLCVKEVSGKRFAIKVFRKYMLRRQRQFIGAGMVEGMKVRTSLDKIHNELSVLKRLSHPNCILLHAVIDDGDPDGKLYMVLEYAERGATMEWDAGKGMFRSPVTGSTLSEQTACAYVRDTLCGLSYLHKSLIAHRDVKPQNLLLTATGQVKVADFGASICMDANCIVRGTEGTYHFYSPEMCRTGYRGHDGCKADVWATGVSLWVFLFGSLPFFDEDLSVLMDLILQGNCELPTSASALSPACRRTLLGMLAPDPTVRPLCDAALEDEWFSASSS